MVVVLTFFVVERLPDRIFYFQRHKLINDKVMMTASLKDTTVHCTRWAASPQICIDHLADWEARWLVSFHPDKCQFLHITRKRNLHHHLYHLQGHPLKSAKETKFLGVMLSDDLRWDCHITSIATNSSKILGLLWRNLKVGFVTTKERAYKALARPTLEFTSPVWDLHTAKNINKLQSVQRRAACWVVDYHRHWDLQRRRHVHAPPAAASKVTQTTSEAGHFIQTPPWRKGHRLQLPTCPQPTLRSTRQSHNTT